MNIKIQGGGMKKLLLPLLFLIALLAVSFAENAEDLKKGETKTEGGKAEAMPAGDSLQKTNTSFSVNLPQQIEETNESPANSGTNKSGESGWDKCERNTRLAGMTSLLGGVINLFCTGAAAIDRAITSEPKNEYQEEENKDKEKEKGSLNESP
jgi:hypothetical protein